MTGLLAKALLLLLFLAFSHLDVQAQPASKRVLVLHSYHQGYKWTDDITAGIESVLDPRAQYVELQIEYMDTKRIADREYMDRLVALYEHKFARRDFDVIISSDNNAFNFLLAYRDRLFPGTPVVFTGVNFFDNAVLEGHELFTGISEEADLRAGIDVALSLHPETERIVVVNDTTTTGVAVRGKLLDIMPAYEERLEFILLEDVTMDEVRHTVAALPADSLVFYTVFFRDRDDRFFEYDESIRLVTEASAAPVYGTWDFSLGYGIVGGMLTSGFFQGEAAAEMAQRILQGESIASIPILLESPNRYMFDYEVLEGYGIPRSRLPENSIVVNRPVTFYSQYKAWVWGGALAIAGLSLSTLVLSFENRRRRRAERALQASHQELQAMHGTLEERVADRTRRLETVASLGAGLTTILDFEQLLRELVNQVKERFGYYHVQIFILDETGDNLVPVAGYGEVGAQLRARGFHIPLPSEVSLVARAARGGEIVWVNNVDESPEWLAHELLPDTRTEMCVPIIFDDRVIGVLDVQQAEENSLEEADADLLRSLASQVAVALRNAQLFDELFAARREAERANELKTQFLSNMSHELRTPLNAVINFAGFVADGIVGDVNEQQERMLEKVIDGGQHLLSLINDILDVTKIEAGVTNLIFEELDLAPVLDSVAAAAQGLLKDKPVLLECRIAPDLPLIVGDQRRLRQLLLNLLSNAIKYTLQGEITLAAAAADGGIHITLADTGIGIASEHFDSLFQTFQARHNLDNVVSTGLGLAISRQLVELHSGRIWVESEVGVGSTFHVFLPAQPAPQEGIITLEERLFPLSSQP